MTSEQTVQYLLSFLGGGFAVAVGNWINTSIGVRRQRGIDHVKSQLQSLYGPLSFFSHQNEKLLELCSSLIKVYNDEIGNKNWSSSEHTQASVRRTTDDIIKVSNQYVARVVENNGRIMEILEKNWHLIDSEDIEEFSHFQIDYTRLKTEFEAGLNIPLGVYKGVGEISYIRPSMINLIKSKTLVKQDQLQSLMRPLWWHRIL